MERRASHVRHDPAELRFGASIRHRPSPVPADSSPIVALGHFDADKPASPARLVDDFTQALVAVEWSRPFWLWLAIALLGATLLSTRAAAQADRRLELHVIDSVNGAPVEHAEVRVLKTVKDTAGWMIQRTTDSSGRALVAVPGNEHLLMLVRRLGYSSSLLQVTAANDDDTVFVALAPTALALGTTVTTATPLSRRLTESGFYDRQRTRPGAFLDSAAIAARKPIDFMAVVRPFIRNACTVAYLDGLALVDVRDIDVRRVLGVEVYASNTEAPAEFRNPMDSEHRCATILIWRRSP